MCPQCHGLGTQMTVSPALIVADPRLSLLDGALRWYGELRLYADQADDRFWAVRIPAAIGDVHLELYSTQRGIELCRAGHELAERFDAWPAPRGHCLVAIAMAHLQQGELGAAETALRRAEELLDGDAWARWCWHVPLLRVRGELALASGELENAWGYASQSLELAVQADSRRDVAHAKLVLGEIAAAQDRLPEAEKLLHSAVALAEHMSAARELWLAASALGRVLERLGRDHEAETPLTLAAQTIEAITVELADPHLRASFVAAAPVADIYRRLRRPAPSPRLSA
jgi:tetratricopeptide (TPR) repeat protein